MRTFMSLAMLFCVIQYLFCYQRLPKKKQACSLQPAANNSPQPSSTLFTLSDEYHRYGHLVISYPHLFSYHRYAMNLHFEFFPSLFYTFFSLSSPYFSLSEISFFFNYLSYTSLSFSFSSLHLYLIYNFLYHRHQQHTKPIHRTNRSVPPPCETVILH